MKHFLSKTLALTTAAVALTLGASTGVMAQTNANALGSVAIVPYYTVQDDYITGLHITNTTNSTQMVKVRVRRAKDSLEVLDFVIAMSPYDMWTGYLSDEQTGKLTFTTKDKSCTVPLNTGTIVASAFGPGSGFAEGYIEVIGMAEVINEGHPVPRGALHNAMGIPANCGTVRTNLKEENVIDLDETRTLPTVASTRTMYKATNPRAFKVSYFIRDAASGMEFGDNAQHVLYRNADAPAYGPMMANQQEDDSTNGTSYPSLEGSGTPTNAGTTGAAVSKVTGRYQILRDDLGGDMLINDWSRNPISGITTDWVITAPGQHLLAKKDIPLTAVLDVFDREEQDILVVSPARKIKLPYEVNVLTWDDDMMAKGIFNSSYLTVIGTSSSRLNGWAKVELRSANSTVCLSGSGALTYTFPGSTCNTSNAPTALTGDVPVIGFAAWRRNFGNASLNYGRIVPHSRAQKAQ